MTEPILFSYGFDGAGGGQRLEGAEISRQLRDEQLAWVHLDCNAETTRDWLLREVDYLDPSILDALLAEETRPRLSQVDDGILLILRGVNLNEEARPEDMVSVRLFVDQHRIISVRRRKLRAVLDMEKRILGGHGPRDSGEFIAGLVGRLFERMEPVLNELDDQTDRIEAQLLERADIELREMIVGVRKQAIQFRRYMSPQRDAIRLLINSEVNWLSGANKRHLQQSHDRITRYVEDLDAVRERSQIIKDELANVLADKLNKNMYILSIISATFLPLGFVTGLLGINVGGIPWAENNLGFLLVVFLLVLVFGVQLYWFKRMKWF